MTKITPLSFVCINCGNRVKELYKKFSSSVIKITKCDKCHKIADKYIEFEPIIILIDLVLLSQAAYRHVLFNTNFKLHWKLSLVLLLLESFTMWRQKLNELSFLALNDSIVAEKTFYFCCLQNIIENLILFLILQLIYFVNGFIEKQSNVFSLQYSVYLWKAITTANLSKFFLLPIMIWKDNTTEFGLMLHYLLVMSYFVLSFIHVHSVVANMSKTRSTIVVISTIILKQFLTVHVTKWMETNFFF